MNVDHKDWIFKMSISLILATSTSSPPPPSLSVSLSRSHITRGFEGRGRAGCQSWKCDGQLPVIRQILKTKWRVGMDSAWFICQLCSCERLDGFIKGTSVKMKNGSRHRGSTLTFDTPKRHRFRTWHFHRQPNSNPFPPHLPSLLLIWKSMAAPPAPSARNSCADASF